MIEPTNAFISKNVPKGSETVPDSIKTHSSYSGDIKVIPDENKRHSGDASRPRIIPNENVPDINRAFGREGVPFNTGENIKIAPENHSVYSDSDSEKIPSYIKIHNDNKGSRI